MVKVITTALLLFALNAHAFILVCGEPIAGEAPSCTTISESCTTTSNQTDSGFGATYRWKASKFLTSGGNTTVCKMRFKLDRVGSPTFTITFAVYASTGTEPDEASVIGTSDSISASGLSTTMTWTDIPVTTTFNLTDATEYWIVAIASANGDASNYVEIDTDTGCDYEEGIKYSSNGTSWTGSDSNRGFRFYFYE